MYINVSHKRFYSQFFYTKPNFSFLESTSHTRHAGMLLQIKIVQKLIENTIFGKKSDKANRTVIRP